MKIEDLYPNPKNPRKISDEQLCRLKKSLETFGDLSGIIFNEVTGRLAGGHQRLKCLPKDAGINITKKYEEPTKQGTVALGHIKINGELFSYRQVRWDEPTELAANVAANKHGGEWGDNLADILLEIDTANIDLDLTGFSKEELDKLMAPVWPIGKCDEDEVPEHVEPKTKLGDLYKLGVHRLLCGDSTNIQHVERLMNGEKADMVFTDPPYGMNLDTDYTKMPVSPTGAKPKKWKPIEGDNSEFDPLFILATFNECKEIILWGFDYYAYRLPSGTPFVWDKRVTENFDKMIGSAFELAWSKAKHKREICRLNNTLYSGEADAINKLHPTQKPIKLIEWFFERIKGERVIDLFGGSGSTLIACEKTNRKCFMMELDPHYCDVIVARWEKYTGKKAELTV